MTIQLGQLTEPQFIISVTISLVVVTTSAIAVTVKVWPIIRKTNLVLSDLAGEDARPGVPAKPGVMERLQVVEDLARKASYHTSPNGGGSSHDKLFSKLETIETDVMNLNSRLDESREDRAEIWHTVNKLVDLAQTAPVYTIRLPHDENGDQRQPE